jgi:peptide/nickel transport system permease protein
MGALGAILARRVVQAILVSLLVSLLCFLLMRLLPGDMAYRIAAGRYGYDYVNAESAQAVRAELGLDRPMLAMLAAWWSDLLRLDLGVSFVSGESVWAEVAHELGHTLLLAVSALALGLLLGPPLGFLAALRPGGWLDRLTLAGSVLGRALPPFVLALLLVLLFSVQVPALPAAGHGEHGNLLLPALTLALGLAAASSRVARDAMAAVVRSPFFDFALAKGLTERQALLRHGVRNAAVPVLAYLGVQLAFLVEGVVVVETLFAWPGIGHALVHAIFQRDVPMIQGAALVMAMLFVALNSLVDVACAALDPRRRTR